MARFEAATESPLRESVANALFNKGVALGALGRSEEAIAAYDDLLARFGSAIELPLRELVANALVNKGIMLGALGRSEDAIVVYDDLLARFMRRPSRRCANEVANALFNKGVTLGALGRSEERSRPTTIYWPASRDDRRRCAIGRQRARQQGGALSALGRSEDAIAAYDDLLSRFASATELPLRELVAKALVNKDLMPGDRAKFDVVREEP